MKQDKPIPIFGKNALLFWAGLGKLTQARSVLRATTCIRVNGNSEKPFFPSGAIAFFVVLVVFYAALWLVIYGVMIARS